MPSSQRIHDSKGAVELQQGNTNHARFRATCTRVDEWQRDRLDPLRKTVKIVGIVNIHWIASFYTLEKDRGEIHGPRQSQTYRKGFRWFDSTQQESSSERKREAYALQD